MHNVGYVYNIVCYLKQAYEQWSWRWHTQMDGEVTRCMKMKTSLEIACAERDG